MLPIIEFRDEILQSIARHRVTCITGETGCGKSSMVPQFIVLDAADRGKRVRVLLTQPRRVAAVTLARRISRQLGDDLGSQVGYRIGNEDRTTSKDNLITVATAGYLLQHLSRRPESIKRYSHLVLDEVHERAMDMDLLNLLIKKLFERENLRIKLILMSATLQSDTIINYFFLDDVIPISIHVGQSPFRNSTVYLDSLQTILPNPKQLASVISSALDGFNVAALSGSVSAVKPQVASFHFFSASFTFKYGFGRLRIR